MKVITLKMKVTLGFLRQRQTSYWEKRKEKGGGGYLNLNLFMSADDNLLKQAQFSYHRINFERRENKVDARTL